MLPLDKGLEEDGVTFGVKCLGGFCETYTRRPFSFVLADELYREQRLGCLTRKHFFYLATATIEQIRKDLASGAYRL